MSQIKVSASELKIRAERLNEMNATLKTKVDEFQSSANALAVQWEGEARNAFVDACNQDQEQMNNFIQVIQAFYQSLLTMAQKYEEAEIKNVEIANTRTYSGGSQ